MWIPRGRRSYFVVRAGHIGYDFARCGNGAHGGLTSWPPRPQGRVRVSFGDPSLFSRFGNEREGSPSYPGDSATESLRGR